MLQAGTLGDGPMNHYHSPVYTKLSEYLFNCRKNSVNVRIALVLLRKIKQFPAINIEEVAMQAHTTPPSVTRFCQRLGYSRFLALKEDLQPYPGGPLPTSLADQHRFCCPPVHIDCLPVAQALTNSRELLLLGNDYSFTSSSLLREALTNDHRKVYQLHRQSDSQLLAAFIQRCDTVVLTDLTGSWRRKHPELGVPLSRCTTICLTTCPSAEFDYNLDLSITPGFFRSHYYSSQIIVSTVCHLIHLINHPTATSHSFSKT